MNPIHIDDLESPPIIGQTYLVPCIQTYRKFGSWLPILKDFHVDPEVSTRSHVHLDCRFLSAKQRKKITQIKRNDFIITAHVYNHPLNFLNDKRFVSKEITIKPRECFSLHQFVHDGQPYQPNVEPNIAHTCENKIMKNMICPHHGISLKNQPIENNCVTCPAHALKWNVKTGKMQNV